jgi:hypothetical protein
VVAVVGFVVVLSVGASPKDAPGSRVRVVRADAPAGFAVLAGRCREQRVVSVDVAAADGATVWRIESRTGSIERRYPVGAAPPLGFRDVVQFRDRPDGRVRATVIFDRDGATTTDTLVADVASLPEQGDALAESTPGCGGHVGLGDATPLFAVAALLVVGGYVVMLVRAVRRP